MDGVLKRKPKQAFDLWRKYVQAVNNQEILDNVRTQKLLQSLSKVSLRTLRDCSERILGDGSKVKGAIKKIYMQMLRMPRTAIEQWKKYIVGLKNRDFFDNLRSAKLMICLTRIPIRKMRDASQRIIGEGSKVKGAMQSLINALKMIPKNALKTWLRTVQAIRDRKLYDNTRSFKLQIRLEGIHKRSMREAYERISGRSFLCPRVREVLRAIDMIIRRKPKQAFEQWRKYALAVNEKMILDNVRSHRLQIALSHVSLRTSKDTMQRIIGEGDKVRGALKSLVNGFNKLVLRGFAQWKAYLALVNKHQVLDNLRSERLKSALSRLHLRTVKDSHERIVGEGSKVNGALRRIVLAGQKKPKLAFEQWKKFVATVKNRTVLDLVRSHKLLNSLSRIANRTLRDSNIRIVGEGDKVRGALRRIFIQLNKNTRIAFVNWTTFVKAVNDKLIFNNSRAQKLLQALLRVPRRTIKLSSDRIMGEGNQALGALRRLAISGSKLPKTALNKWKEFVSACKHGHLMDNIRSQRLKYFLSAVPRRTFKEIFERVYRANEKAKDKLTVLTRIHSKKPLRATANWKASVEVDKVVKPLKGNRLMNVLGRLPLRNFRKVLDVINHEDNASSKIRRLFIIYSQNTRKVFGIWQQFVQKCKRGDVFDVMRAQKLNNFMSRIPSRLLRNSILRVLGDGSRALGALRLLATTALNRPRQAWKSWRDYVDRCKRGELFDRMRAQKLTIHLRGIITRTMRTASSTVITAQDKIKHMFRLWEVEIIHNFRGVWSMWREFVARTKRGELMDAVKTQKLRTALENVPKRTMRDAFERVIGDGSRVKAALRRLEISALKVRDSAYFVWRDFMMMQRKQESLRNLRAWQLKNNMTALSVRTIRDALLRMLGDGTKVLGCLRRLAIIIKNQQKETFLHWRQKIINKGSGHLTKGMKIRHVLEAVARRTLKGAFNKILGDLRAKRGIARMIRNLVNQQRCALERLRERVMKLRMIKKVNSAYILMKMLGIKFDQMVAGRFRIWKNEQYIRKMRLMRRALMHMVFYASINYENGFWKWKFVLTRFGDDVNPKHAVMGKRLSQVCMNYQTRMKQFALFKVLLHFRQNPVPQTAKKSLQFAVSSLVKAQRDEQARSPSPERRVDSKVTASVRGSVSTDAAGKLSKEELVGVNQLGGAEVIALQLRNCRLRNLAVGFASVSVFSKQIGVFDDERSRLIEQINELRYDKHSLLEDNTALRHHNEALIDNLEKTNMNFQSLSLHLDQMRLGRMVRVISKMIELPMLEALIMVKHYTGVN
jgi:hypothetical protein